MTVGGVLTYEDAVTNVDSLGMVTARIGVRVSAGGINAVGVVTATSFEGDGSNLSGISVGLTTEAELHLVLLPQSISQVLKTTKLLLLVAIITVTGGTEADSHTLRIVNSGIATIGFGISYSHLVLHHHYQQQMEQLV